MQAPIHVSELELTEPIIDIDLPAPVDGVPYTGVYLLVRLQRVPVSYTFIASNRLDSASVIADLWDEVGPEVNRRRSRAGLPMLDGLPADGIPVEAVLDGDELTEFPTVTVAVCTRDRPESVITTLRSIAALNYPNYDILVVDNAPSSDATMIAVRENFKDDPRVSYVREPKGGTSFARNRALKEATGDILAYADDDVIVDQWWLRAIVQGFQSAPDVAAVTGMISTAVIENDAQLYFHLRLNWGAVGERRVFDLKDNRDDSPIYPYSAGIFGGGCNFSVSRAALKDVGGFNEALGGGVPAGGGEDLNMFIRIILSGHQLVVQPAAIVHHRHRATTAELAKQMSTYGSGATASLLAVALSSARARRELPVKAVQGLVRLMRVQNPADDVSQYPTLPKGMLRLEMRSLALGPWLYLKGVRRNKRLYQGSYN
jgi:GT2 family glycosyltransferase